MAAWAPDPDWYLDHVVVPSGPERHPVGPARSRQAAWGARHAALLRGADRSPLGLAGTLACRQGFVLTRSQARRCGLADADVRRFVRRREWAVPRHGVVGVLPPRPGGPPDRLSPGGADPEVRAAAAALVRPGSVVSHLSAAAIHGLPLLDGVPRPTLTAQRAERTCARDHVRVHVAALGATEVEDWFGIAVTTVARTVVDVARSSGVADGLVAADAALHERLVTQEALLVAANGVAGWPGAAAARRVAALAQPLAESPLESLSRLCLADGGLPAPEVQAWVVVADGRRYRVDLLWRERRVVLEADGRLKYERSAALWEEKRRQERIEGAGYRVVRVNWADVVHSPAETVARIRAALSRPAYGSP